MANPLPSPYLAIRAESDRIKIPTAFRTDLTKHDRAWIRRNPETPFVWIPRETGTSLCAVTTDEIDGAHHHAWDFPRWHQDERDSRFYVWDGARLREYPDARACSTAVHDLADEIKAREGSRSTS